MLRGLLSRKAAHVALVIVLGALVYANTIGVPFLFDDRPNISANPIVKDISFFTDTGRAASFERYDALRSRYVGYLTFFLNFRADGLDVRGYHMVNVLIHIISALLVYALVMLSFRTPVLRESRLFEKRRWVSLLAAVLFVAHPVNTQAVTYLVQRFASLAALFYLGSMVCYIASRTSEGKARRLYYTGALVLAVLAMKTKENAFTLPVAMAMFEFVFFRDGPKKKRALLLLPFVLTMLIVPLTLLDLGRPAADVMTDFAEKTVVQHISRETYLVTELRVMATYLRLLVLPINQNLDYDYPLFTSMTRGPALGGLALVVLLVGLAVWLLRRKEPAAKLASFGIVFFFLALSVESTVVPLFPIFEHRLYLPGAGMFVAASAGAAFLHETVKSGTARTAVAVLLAVSVIALSVQTVQRNSVWRGEVPLWSDVVEKSPGKPLGYANLGAALKEAGRAEEAIETLRKAVSLEGSTAGSYVGKGISESYDNLGLAFLKKQDYRRATEYFRSSIRSQPDNATAYLNLGTVYAAEGLLDTAIEQFRRSAELDPALAAAPFNLGLAYAEKGSFDRAQEQLRRAVHLDPVFTEAYFYLGMAAYDNGEMEEARMMLEKTLRLNPKHAGAREYLNLMRK
jgi:Flp pilus assembly protein TadD